MQKQREHWSSHIGFILAAAGSAVGLGTLWQVPYTTGKNGGGAFVLIYMLCILLVGIPVFVSELILGRRAQKGAVATFDVLYPEKPFWKLGGWLGVIASFIIMSYYSVIAGFGLNYTFMSLNQFYLGKTPAEISAVYETLIHSGDIVIFWHLIFTLITVGVVYLGIKAGIEFWSKFMMTGLFLMLIGLTAFSVTLPGFRDAVTFLFYPDWTNFKPASALEALGLAFFTLSVGQGIMITYGSYMRKSEDIPKTGAIIGVTIVAVAALAGLMIFPIIFSYGYEPAQGPGLVFKILPVLLSQFPGALIISTAFFLLFVFAALTSSIAMVEVIVATLMDLQGWSRHRSVLLVGAACFLLGIPSALADTSTLFSNWKSMYGVNFFETMNALVSNWLLPVGGFLIALYTGWVLDKEISKEEFQAGTAWKSLWKYWFFFIRYVAPVAIALIMLQNAGLIDINNWSTK
jgi:NSS family neurotransmitter:Na+ symporter